MQTETTTTFDTTAPTIKIAVAIDYKTAAILALAIFVSLLGALIIYKNV